MGGDSRADEHLAAGRDALARGAWQEAHDRLKEAVSLGAGADALEELSWAAWWLEDVPGCLDARERAYHGYREQGDRRSAARMALWLGDDHASFRGAHAVADGWFARARRLLQEVEPCAEHGWLAVFDAHTALGAADLGTASTLAREAQEHGRRHGAVALEMFAVATEGVVRVEQGDIVEGLRCLDEAVTAALSGEYEQLAPAAWAACLLLSTCEQLRDYDRAGQWCRQVEAFSERMDARFLRGVCRSHYGVVRAWQGDWDEAERELVGALTSLGTEHPSWRADALTRLGEFRRRQGRWDEAEALFEQAGPPGLRGLAAVRLDTGRPSEALELLERARRHTATTDGVAGADVLEAMVRTLIALEEQETAAATLSELRVIAEAAKTDALWAAVHRCEGALAFVTGAPEHACEHLEQAADRLRRSGAQVEAASARTDLAEILADLGRHDAARREARLALAGLTETDAEVERTRAQALLERLGSPDGASTDGDPSLTSRQVEVLALIARGRSDRQIAEQLVLSPHTVHRHVANIYARLGCSSRAEAVARATRAGLL